MWLWICFHYFYWSTGRYIYRCRFYFPFYLIWKEDPDFEGLRGTVCFVLHTSWFEFQEHLRCKVLWRLLIYMGEVMKLLQLLREIIYHITVFPHQQKKEAETLAFCSWITMRTSIQQKSRSHVVSTKRTFLSPFTKEYRVIAA